MNTLPKIALTGGPGGGKSTTLEHLSTAMPHLQLVPEAATAVLRSGYPMPGPNRPWTTQWQHCFQTAVWGMQAGLDQLAEYDAQQRNASAIVYDRCTVDPVAYYDSIEEYERECNTTLAHELGKLSLVLFLPTYAGTANFDNSTNQLRVEDQRKMIQLNDKLLEAWQQHPKLIVIDNAKLADRARTAEEILRLHIGQHI